MGESSISPPDLLSPAGPPIRLRRWFYAYFPLVAILAAVTLYIAAHQPQTFYDSLHQVPAEFRAVRPWYKGIGHAMRFFWDQTLALATPGLKFSFFLTYMCMATTFFPLPTGALVSFVAAERGQFVPSDLWNALLVATFGAAASTIANLTDYHFFLWLLRNRRIASVRDTRAYHTAARWFAKDPFKIMVAFNIILVPVDVVRMLAAVYGYPRTRFAAANYLGRFLRYGGIVGVTVLLGAQYDWIGPVAFLAITVLIALAKGLPRLWRRAKP